MSNPWPDLKWWNSGERQVVEEKLHDLKREGVVFNPELVQLYKALRVTPESSVRVMVVGQDPYPDHSKATGVAFSIPRGVAQKDYPHTLKIILGEYCSDLGYDIPSHGDLQRWISQGTLLWNAIPSCQAGKPLSHDWDEWGYLTREIVGRLSSKGGVVFALLGGVAHRYSECIDPVRNRVIRCSHPSPRGIRTSKTPFTGSRLFSTINAKLVEIGQGVIDWELKDVPPRKGDIQDPGVGGGKVLPNLTGANLGGLKKQGTSPNIYTSLAF